MIYRKIGAMAILLAITATTAGCGWGYYSSGEEGNAVHSGSAAASQEKIHIEPKYVANPGTDHEKIRIGPTDGVKLESGPLIETVKDEAMTGIFETTLETAEEDGKLELAFALSNISGKDITIEHGSGQQYDINVYNGNNEEVYRWSHNRAFTLALITRELKAGDMMSFEETWDGTDNEGKPLPAGEYTVKVTIAVRAAMDKVDSEELTAETKVTLPFSK